MSKLSRKVKKMDAIIERVDDIIVNDIQELIGRSHFQKTATVVASQEMRNILHKIVSKVDTSIVGYMSRADDRTLVKLFHAQPLPYPLHFSIPKSLGYNDHMQFKKTQAPFVDWDDYRARKYRYFSDPHNLLAFMLMHWQHRSDLLLSLMDQSRRKPAQPQHVKDTHKKISVLLARHDEIMGSQQ